MNNANAQDSRLELLAKIQDPNEFITIFRAMVAEENQTLESDLFPFTEDTAGEIIYNSLGIWLATCATLPIENREQVITAMDKIASMLKQMQKRLPDNPEQLMHVVLHCLRKGVAPQLWKIKFDEINKQKIRL
ncbi:MAG: hypothetical protein M3R14_05145 [Acidobacteriota bacterium]|nr:hypothetical protein [Acidobacteriota bacterium]